MTHNDDDTSWAIVHVDLSPDRTDAQHYADSADRLEELGALVALERWAGGVETRDNGTWTHREHPGLAIYTTPPQVETALGFVARTAAALNLTVTLRQEVFEGENWRDVWKRYYQPQIFGEHGPRPLLLRPSWLERRPNDPRAEVILDPGRAFGTGLHESTRLCLRWLCEAPGLCDEPIATVLDAGCGSGVLGLAAARLFGARVLALDFDEEATDTTRENAALNDARVDTLCGPVSALASDARFDLVLANIRPSVLIPEATTLVAALRPGRVGVLSGILLEEAPEILDAYRPVADEVTIFAEEGEWCAISFRGRA